MTALGLVLSTFAHLSEKKDVYEYQVHKDNKKLAGDIPPASFFHCFNVMLITVCLSLSAKEIFRVSGTPSFSKTTA